MRRPSLILGLLGPLLLCACAPGQENGNLIYLQRTVIGFDAAASTAGNGGHILLGYDRQFVTIVPTRADGTAMSEVSCSEVRSKGLTDMTIEERLVTGQAAINYSGQFKADQAGTPFLGCFTGDTPVPGAE